MTTATDLKISSVAATKPLPPLALVKATLKNFADDNATVIAGAVAFTALQSILPLILGIVAVGSLLLQDGSTRKNFQDAIVSAIPADVNKTININQIINDFIKGAGAVSIISIATLLWSGSSIFSQLRFAINTAFGIRKDPRPIYVQIGLQLGMLLVLGGLLLAAFAVSIITGIIFTANISLFGVSPSNFSFVLSLISFALPLVLEVAVFAILYRLSPGRKGVRWKLCFVAGAATALLFEVLKYLFGLYLSLFGAASSAQRTYGAIGGVFVFMLLLYLTSMVIILGAEFAANLHQFRQEPATSASIIATTSEVETETEKPKERNGLAAFVGGAALVTVALFTSSRNRNRN